MTRTSSGFRLLISSANGKRIGVAGLLNELQMRGSKSGHLYLFFRFFSVKGSMSTSVGSRAKAQF